MTGGEAITHRHFATSSFTALETFPSVARDKFTRAMGQVFSLVTVVSTDGSAGRYAVTVSSASSASADPPLVFACIQRRSPVASAIHSNGVFCVNVLAVGQEDVSDNFAGRAHDRTPFDFARAEWTTGRTGAPVLKGSVAAFDCLLHSSHGAGTHTAFFGRVLDVVEDQKLALIYGRRTYARPSTDRTK